MSDYDYDHADWADRMGDDLDALALIVRGLWEQLGSVQAITTVTGCTPYQIDHALKLVELQSPIDVSSSSSGRARGAPPA